MNAPGVMLFEFVGETVENAIAAFVQPAASNVMSAVSGTVLIGTTLYLAIMGYLIIAGYLSNPFWDVVKKCAKIAFIGAIALSAGHYMEWVVGGINGLQEGLAAALNTGGADPGGSIYKTLDTSLDHAFDLVGQCFAKANDSGWDVGSALGWWFSGAAIGLGAVLFTLIGGAIVITAKFALAALFAVGPLFIVCLMWPATARFFDSWFSQAMNYVFTIVLVAVFMSFGMAAFDRFIQGADVSGDGTNSPAFAALQILGIAGIFSYMLHQVGSLASSIAGGVSMAAMSLRQMALPVTTTARAASGGLSSAGRILNPTSQRLDPISGLQTTSSRLEHIAFGRSYPLNSTYRQALRERRRQMWSGKNSVRKSD
ncbi:MAG: type IV secretion system protein [Proteobacteria bacterium]|nr:type IV secretion system protein [Pseudomonadota bacterium]